MRISDWSSDVCSSDLAKLAAFVGIDPAHGEPIQGQRYALGQEFKAHTDYFEPGGIDFERFCAVSGNRTWTLMVYLNEPAAGGATRFVKIGKTEIGRAHVCTPVTNAHIVCRLLLENKHQDTETT